MHSTISVGKHPWGKNKAVDCSKDYIYNNLRWVYFKTGKAIPSLAVQIISQLVTLKTVGYGQMDTRPSPPCRHLNISNGNPLLLLPPPSQKTELCCPKTCPHHATPRGTLDSWEIPNSWSATKSSLTRKETAGVKPQKAFITDHPTELCNNFILQAVAISPHVHRRSPPPLILRRRLWPAVWPWFLRFDRICKCAPAH